jgi:HEAT repeat protein
LPDDPEVASLVSAFLVAEPTQQAALVDQLLQQKSTAALKGVLQISTQLPPGELKSHICRQLSSMEPQESRNVIFESLPKVDSDTRRALAQSLGTHADSAFVLTLIERFDHAPDSRTKSNALQVLKALNSRQAIETLNSVLADPGNQASAPVIKVAAQVVSENATAPIVNTLTARMDRTTDSKELVELADVVSTIRTPASRSALIYAAKGNRDSTRPPTRVAAIRALSNFPSAESMEALRQLQTDPNVDVQTTARQVAEKMQDALGR